MTGPERTAVAGVAVSVVLGLGVAWAGSQQGVGIRGLPVFALAAGLAFAINWVAFVPAYRHQTERYFDLTGSLTYLTVVAVALGATGRWDPRAGLLGLMVTLWAVRLGSFLFARIRRDGSDARFTDLKPSLWRFLMTWTLQALWVLLTVAAGLAAITTATPVPLDAWAAVGGVIWLAGFTIEAVADRQKRRFRLDPAHHGRFIRTGLWAWSRHPNYFGEITLWLGVAVVAWPALTGWQHVTLISPVFVYVLLTRVSGIPLLEARAEAAWGDDPDYRAYRAATPVLVPRPPRG